MYADKGYRTSFNTKCPRKRVLSRNTSSHTSWSTVRKFMRQRMEDRCVGRVRCTRYASRQFLRASVWIDGKLEKNNPFLQTLVTVPLSLSSCYFPSISTGGIAVRLHRISLITSEYRSVVYRIIVILLILERETPFIIQNLYLQPYRLSKHQLN